jgi:hypothetical protein
VGWHVKKFVPSALRYVLISTENSESESFQQLDHGTKVSIAGRASLRNRIGGKPDS